MKHFILIFRWSLDEFHGNNCVMTEHKDTGSGTVKATNKGSGDPVQRAARELRIKQNLRANLRRRKSKARALRDTSSDALGNEVPGKEASDE